MHSLDCFGKFPPLQMEQNGTLESIVPQRFEGEYKKKTYKKLGGGDLDDALSFRSLSRSRSRFCGGGLKLLRLGLDLFGERENRFDLRLFRNSGDLERDRDLERLLLRLFDLLKNKNKNVQKI